MTTRIPFDIREIPFSTRGSWLNISPVVGLHRVADDLHLVSHQTGMNAVLRLGVHGARGEALMASADSSVLTWTGEGAHVQAVFERPSVIRMRGTGATVTLADAASELTPFTGTFLYRDPNSDADVFTSYETGRRYRISVLSGSIRSVGAEALGRGERSVAVSSDDGSAWEIALEEFATTAPPLRLRSTFAEAVSAADERFADYADAHSSWRDESTPAAVIAAYVLWSATVSPAGSIGREAVLMSKHWMDKVWSWDHCFNAMALAAADPAAAIGQFLLPFDHQSAEGALPDSVAHSEVLYNYVKPPIHGWAFARMRGQLDRVPGQVLEEVYERLSAWTEFWLRFRVAPGRTAPYYQHGNDSGWDNSTTFDSDRVIESPDLVAFLVLQLGVLADLAGELGRPADAWREHRRTLIDTLLEMWNGSAFEARSAHTGAPTRTTSLLNLLPLVAAEVLPEEIVDTMVSALGDHLTEWGPATEPPSSELYESDGYWRGPIWAPSTLLIEDGLRRAGREDLADLVSARFRRLCETSGFAENFDALTGAGLRDRAYTWTASVYLILAAESVARAATVDGDRSSPRPEPTAAIDAGGHS